jgi:hypothetical protein
MHHRFRFPKGIQQGTSLKVHIEKDFSGLIFKWIENWLQDCKQRMVMLGSIWAGLKSRVGLT